MRKIAVIAGTRPEIIKLAPVYTALKKLAAANQLLYQDFCPIWIATGQHQELASQALAPFGITPDIQLTAMRPGQNLNQLFTHAFELLAQNFEQIAPACVVVQGDTTSALAASLAAFHQQIPIAHVEAGLRTYNLLSPFPEEGNRQLISRLASLHLCPTPRAAKNLHDEGITKNVEITGNTIVDALESIRAQLANIPTSIDSLLSKLKPKPLLLVTAHRRENFDSRLEYLCETLIAVLRHRPDLHIVFPVHLNPNVRGPVLSRLANHSQISLLDPVDYPSLLKLMDYSSLIVTDSGGIQEEAPSFGKYVIVTRDTTERPELIEAGGGELCALEPETKLDELILKRLQKPDVTSCAGTSPFGDGKSGLQCAELIYRRFCIGADVST